MDFNNIDVSPITKESILKFVSEMDIFLRYCSNFKEFSKSFLSELRNENNPSCRIYTNDNNTLKYKDFASGDNFDCWNYVMQKFNCNYYEALNIISNDFNLGNGNMLINPRIIAANDEFKPIIKSKIEFIKQPWNITDYNFWSQYCIDFKILDFYNVISASSVILYKGNERFIFHYSKSKPRYGYIFKNSNKNSSSLINIAFEKGKPKSKASITFSFDLTLPKLEIWYIPPTSKISFQTSVSILQSCF